MGRMSVSFELLENPSMINRGETMKGNDKSLSIEVLNHTALEREDFIDDSVNEDPNLKFVKLSHFEPLVTERPNTAKAKYVEIRTNTARYG